MACLRVLTMPCPELGLGSFGGAGRRAVRARGRSRDLGRTDSIGSGSTASGAEPLRGSFGPARGRDLRRRTGRCPPLRASAGIARAGGCRQGSPAGRGPHPEHSGQVRARFARRREPGTSVVPTRLRRQMLAVPLRVLGGVGDGPKHGAPPGRGGGGRPVGRGDGLRPTPGGGGATGGGGRPGGGGSGGNRPGATGTGGTGGGGSGNGGRPGTWPRPSAPASPSTSRPSIGRASCRERVSECV